MLRHLVIVCGGLSWGIAGDLPADGNRFPVRRVAGVHQHVGHAHIGHRHYGHAHIGHAHYGRRGFAFGHRAQHGFVVGHGGAALFAYSGPVGYVSYAPPLCGYHAVGPPWYASYGAIALPPLFVDGTALFVRPGMNWRGPVGGIPAAAPPAVAPAPAQAPAPPPPEAPMAERAEPAPLRPVAGHGQRARRFVEFGDKHFRAGKYHQALQRYKKATTADRDFGDAYFRQAFAHLALRKYGRASLAIQRGLTYRPDWPNSGFLLGEVYGDDQQKATHRRDINAWLAEHPLDADAHFVSGVHHYFDGNDARAEAAFLRTVQLTGIGDHAQVFLVENQAP